MENRRFILIALLGVVLFFIYQAWQDEHAVKPTTAATQTIPADSAEVPSARPATTGAPVADADVPQVNDAKPDVAGEVTVRTDVLVATISLHGGTVQRVELLGYPEHKKTPEINVKLLNDSADYYLVAQSGLVAADKPLASHLESFEAMQRDYSLEAGADTLEVPLRYTDASGYAVIKTFRFERNSYQVALTQTLENRTGGELKASPYARLVHNGSVAGEEPKFVHTFLGVGFYEQREGGEHYSFKKHSYKDLAEDAVERQQTGGWIAMLQHYFAVAILPPEQEVESYSSRKGKDGRYQAQYIGPSVTVADQTDASFQTRFFFGPKLQKSIATIAPGFELTVDYGILTAIAEPLFWVLAKFHALTGNWGWSIILLTLLVKGVFYKLSEAQYRSTAKMRKFAPRMQELKERYADDRERLSKAMMELYKKEGFNPLAGCWPLLVQMPVFFSLYWVFLESVELRQAEWVLWFNDLSSPDPYYLLPVLYGLTMFAMQKMSGQTLTMDPMQQRVMNVMPIAMTGFFAFFPAGLVLYWVVSNLIGITQQWYITRKLEKEGLGHK